MKRVTVHFSNFSTEANVKIEWADGTVSTYTNHYLSVMKWMTGFTGKWHWSELAIGEESATWTERD